MQSCNPGVVITVLTVDARREEFGDTRLKCQPLQNVYIFYSVKNNTPKPAFCLQQSSDGRIKTCLIATEGTNIYVNINAASGRILSCWRDIEKGSCIAGRHLQLTPICSRSWALLSQADQSTLQL